MPRPLPQVRASAWYHVTDRAADHEKLLPSPGARDAFLDTLGQLAYEHPVELHAYCAMETHVHVLVRAEESDVEAAFASESLRCRRLAFGRHLLQVTRYIHLNPVEAGLVRRPADWRWSSYAGYVDAVDAPPWLRTAAVLGWLGSAAVRRRYRDYVERSESRRDYRAWMEAP